VSVNGRSRILVDSTIYHIARVSDGPCAGSTTRSLAQRFALHGRGSRIANLQRAEAKNREMMTFIKHLNPFLTIFDISLFRRSNVRGAGFRPRLVQVCMQICPLGPSARETL